MTGRWLVVLGVAAIAGGGCGRGADTAAAEQAAPRQESAAAPKPREAANRHQAVDAPSDADAPSGAEDTAGQPVWTCAGKTDAAEAFRARWRVDGARIVDGQVSWGADAGSLRGTAQDGVRAWASVQRKDGVWRGYGTSAGPWSDVGGNAVWILSADGGDPVVRVETACAQEAAPAVEKTRTR